MKESSTIEGNALPVELIITIFSGLNCWNLIRLRVLSSFWNKFMHKIKVKSTDPHLVHQVQEKSEENWLLYYSISQRLARRQRIADHLSLIGTLGSRLALYNNKSRCVLLATPLELSAIAKVDLDLDCIDVGVDLGDALLRHKNKAHFHFYPASTDNCATLAYSDNNKGAVAANPLVDMKRFKLPKLEYSYRVEDIFENTGQLFALLECEKEFSYYPSCLAIRSLSLDGKLEMANFGNDEVILPVVNCEFTSEHSNGRFHMEGDLLYWMEQSWDDPEKDWIQVGVFNLRTSELQAVEFPDGGGKGVSLDPEEYKDSNMLYIDRYISYRVDL